MRYIIAALFITLLTGITQAGLKDPTQPAAFVKSANLNTLYELSAIIIAPDRRIAVINGMPKKIGDAVLEQRIISIEENIVQLAGPDGKMTLFLRNNSVKTIHH